MASGDWALDTVQGRLTCVLHGDAACMTCAPPGTSGRSTPAGGGVRATPPTGLIGSEVRRILRDKRDSVTMANAFRAYDELLEEACSVLAIQHARLVALEARVAALEAERRR